MPTVRKLQGLEEGVMTKRVEDKTGGRERQVSLAPLDLRQALSGLLQVKSPEKAVNPKRKKAPPTPEKE
jgi:hypothetical protein